MTCWLVKSQHFNLAWIFAEVKSLGRNLSNPSSNLAWKYQLQPSSNVVRPGSRERNQKISVHSPSLSFPKLKHINLHFFIAIPQKNAKWHINFIEFDSDHACIVILQVPCRDFQPIKLPQESVNPTVLWFGFGRKQLWGMWMNKRNEDTHSALPFRGAWVHGSKSQSALLNALALPSPYNRRAALVSCGLEWSLRKCHDEDYAHV